MHPPQPPVPCEAQKLALRGRPRMRCPLGVKRITSNQELG